MQDKTPPAQVIGLCLAGATAAQAVAAILFFFAANWWDWSPATKIGLLDALVLIVSMAAALSPTASFARATWSVAGAVLTGVLFGVHGQIWQTGADSWELFAPWTLFAMFWAVAARADAVWLVAGVLATAALSLWLDGPGRLLLGLAPHWETPALAAAPLTILILREAVSRLPGCTRSAWLPPVLLSLAATALGFAIFGLGQSTLPAWAGLAVAGVVAAIARPARFGPWPSAIALVLAVVLAEALLLHHLSGGTSELERGLRMLLAALLMLAGLGATPVLLRRLFRTQLASPAAQRVLDAATAVGAWLAVAIGLSGWVMVMTTALRMDDHVGLATAIPAASIAAAIRLKREPQAFARHVQAALVIVAYGGLLAEAHVRMHSLGWTATIATLLLPAIAVATREGFAMALATIVALTLAALRLHEASPLAASALAFAMAPAGWVALGSRQPHLRAAALCLLAGAFVLAGAVEFVERERLWAPRLAAVLAGAFLMALALRSRPDLRTPRLAGAGALVLAGALMVPAGGAGLVGLSAAGSRALSRTLVLLGFATAAWSLSRFYYQLSIPLSEKAAWLAAGSALTALAWALATGRRPPALRLRQASPVLLACALAPIALEAWDARAKAQVAEHGRQVLLPLGPADPRSLIQGDFMRLRYHRDLTAPLPAAGGRAYLRLDRDGAAFTARPADGAPNDDEVALDTRPGRREPRLAPDSFLFEEGTAKDWSRARFAIVRIQDGELVLTGLADADRHPIRPERR